MRRLLKLFLLSAVAVFAFLGAVGLRGQGLPPVAQWRPSPHAGQLDLMQGSVQIGALDTDNGRYRPRVGNGWGDFCQPPVPIPEGCCRPGRRLPTGVVNERIGQNRLTIGGKEVDPDMVLGSDLPPDDSGKPYLLVAGDKAFRDQARTLFAPGGKYADLASKFVVGYYPETGFQCKDVGYSGAGVYILGPRDSKTGKAKNYSFQAAPDLDGIDTAARNALRIMDPTYNRRKVPDLRKPLLPHLPNIDLSAPAALAVMGGIGTGSLFVPLLFRRKKRP